MCALALLMVAMVAAASPPPSVAQMKWERRVLLVSAPSGTDPAVATQRKAFIEVAKADDDRDLVLVEALGEAVRGASDEASDLRRRYKLPADRFTVILIGKDGGEKRRSKVPMTSTDVIGTIDAMPMRRSGER